MLANVGNTSGKRAILELLMGCVIVGCGIITGTVVLQHQCQRRVPTRTAMESVEHCIQVRRWILLKLVLI